MGSPKIVRSRALDAELCTDVTHRGIEVTDRTAARTGKYETDAVTVAA